MLRPLQKTPTHNLEKWALPFQDSPPPLALASWDALMHLSYYYLALGPEPQS